MPDGFGQLAERLGGHVDALEERQSGRLPGGHAAGDHAHIAVAEPVQPPRRLLRHAVALIDQEDRRVAARDEGADNKLDPAVGAWHGEEGVALAELPRLTDIEEGDLASGVEARLCLGGGERDDHAAAMLGSRPAKKSRKAG
jgi:hypothetical protein